ncbi:hypothetical protein [Paraburkholderia elongata]|uniref:Uncharacterized protein n=1 Tax=Paraburkholderia elongata TaxID=2675747 RepID=A0A972NYR7_9BURK|nr:hypothetical protein [Paraburkholderia elongata]NPT54909.1 hypothetical protein [Paraburkholderia elongata]NPT60938.1 hypothetical protein [Paraburkholderia elongata]
MTVTFSKSTATSASVAVATTSKLKKRVNGHQKPKTPPSLDIPDARIRVAHFLMLLGELSASAFYARLRIGRVPKPCGYDPRPYWRAEIVREFLQIK